ncbi:MAG: hypothetical protein SFZ23_07965 [Planctomycetota bacterium]|nr:hypothetical protein [Planctomycetota bacterium]
MSACTVPRVELPPANKLKGDVVARGDADDLFAAVSAAAGRHEMAIVRRVEPRQQPSTEATVFELISIRDEDVVLRLEPQAEQSHYLVKARFVRAASSEAGQRLQRQRARALELDVKLRLERLHGVDSAPKPEGW